MRTMRRRASFSRLFALMVCKSVRRCQPLQGEKGSIERTAAATGDGAFRMWP